MRVLVAEDDRPLAAYLSKGFESQQFVVDVASDGAQAKTLALQNHYDLLILDLGLAGIDCLELIQQMRREKLAMPLLVLGALSHVEERVRTLDLGADDYLAKPFSFAELAARSRALLRRTARSASAVLQVQDLELDRLQRTVRRAGKLIELSPKEFALLEYLMQHVGQAVSRADILEQIWNITFDTSTNVVDVYINYLRRKLDAGCDLALIRTIRGRGYLIGPAEQGA